MAGGLSRLNPDDRRDQDVAALRPQPTPSSTRSCRPPDGSVWLTLERQGGLARFDTRAEKFEVFIDQKMIDDYNVAKPVQKDPNDPFPNLPDPRGTQGGGARSHTAAVDHDGNIWVSGRPLKKFDAKTGRYTFFTEEAPDTYGIAVDQKGNVWFAQFNARDHQNIGMVDVKTNKITKYTPPAGVSPRRLKVDSKGMVWIGDYFGGSLTRFDPATQEFKSVQAAGPDADALRHGGRSRRQRLVRLDVHRRHGQARSQDRQGDGISLALRRARHPRHGRRRQGPASGTARSPISRPATSGCAPRRKRRRRSANERDRFDPRQCIRAIIQ